MSRTHNFLPISVACLVTALAFGLPLMAYAQEAQEAPPAPVADDEAYENDEAAVTAVVVPGACAPVVAHWDACCPTKCDYYYCCPAVRRFCRAQARACRRAARAYARACRRAARAHARAWRRAARCRYSCCVVTKACW